MFHGLIAARAGSTGVPIANTLKEKLAASRIATFFLRMIRTNLFISALYQGLTGHDKILEQLFLRSEGATPRLDRLRCHYPIRRWKTSNPAAMICLEQDNPTVSIPSTCAGLSVVALGAQRGYGRTPYRLELPPEALRYRGPQSRRG
jgi:hypothetical protein